MRLGLAWYGFVLGLVAFAASCGSSDDQGLYGASGASGGTAGDAGAAGSSAGVFGSGGSGFAGTGGSGAIGGSDGLDSGADTGGFGGTNGASGSGGQDCQQYCGDADGDGHGDPTKRPTTCANLGVEWVTLCDDCHDGNADVFPGTTACKSVPYLLLDGLTQSFDYDCSGSVTECGEVMKVTGSCAPAGLTCTGNGYLPSAERADAASAPDAYCGSTRYRVCNRVAAILCTAAIEMREAITCL
jgi:hypothetical protein